MENTPRLPTAETKRRLAEPSRLPVLARMPDLSADAPAPRAATPAAIGGVNYRFDPPQLADSKLQPAIRNPKEMPRQPHVLGRGRVSGSRHRFPKRESSILPRSNPFSIPSARLVDSIAPTVRFLTMVALFTAAGTWIQLMGGHATPPSEPAEAPKTASQPAVAPTKNAVDRTLPAPTAAGPLETTPQSGARVGRANDDDFASQPRAAAVTRATEHPVVTPPHFLVADGGKVPRVQTSEPRQTGVVDDPARGEAGDEEPAVASFPGFLIGIPVR